MTHIKNIPHVLEHGITHSSSPNANPHFAPIGDGSLIETRSSFVLNNGNTLGDYIPFYFGVRTPMLYVVQKGFNMVKPTLPQQIVYCVTSVKQIVDSGLDFVFTNGHAVDGFTLQYGRDDVNNIKELIDWNAVKAKYWRDENDLDLKRRKEAEFLVSGDIPLELIKGYVVYDQPAKDTLVEYGVDEDNIKVIPEFYF